MALSFSILIVKFCASVQIFTTLLGCFLSFCPLLGEGSWLSAAFSCFLFSIHFWLSISLSISWKNPWTAWLSLMTSSPGDQFSGLLVGISCNHLCNRVRASLPVTLIICKLFTENQMFYYGLNPAFVQGQKGYLWRRVKKVCRLSVNKIVLGWQPWWVGTTH